MIYDTRSHEPRQLTPYQELLNSAKVTRIYLDELPQENFTSFNMKLIEFIISTQEVAIEKGKRLVVDAQQVNNEDDKIDIMELVETVLGYKFSNLSREELVKMFSLDEFKQSRLYQDISEESKLDIVPALVKRGLTVEEIIVPALVKRGLTVEEIAEIVKLDVEKVRQAVQKSQEK